jgi:hypothetical protein
LIWLHGRVAVPVRVLIDQTVYVVRGFPQPPSPPCENLSDSVCIAKKTTLNPGEIETHFGEQRVQTASTILVLSYLAFTSSFAWLVALLVFKKNRT